MLDALIGVAAALLVSWLVLIVALLLLRPKGAMLADAVRMLPDLLRLVRRLAADRSLPRTVRLRVWLLMAYLAMPCGCCLTCYGWCAGSRPTGPCRGRCGCGCGC